ncbi:MAG: DUF1566 domain-containing protein [Myxococcota bacterium]
MQTNSFLWTASSLATVLALTLGCGASDATGIGDDGQGRSAAGGGGGVEDGGGVRDGGGASDGGGNADDTPRVVSATGQTTCYDVDGNAIDCAGTGQDGDIQAGVPHPSPRFTDRDDGSVRDNLTGLVWLKRASCLGKVNWSEALSRSNALAEGHGDCALSDGSVAGDWRLPNVRELMSLISVSKGYPALAEGHPFVDVKNEMHWTSTSRPDGSPKAWTGSPFASGRFSSGNKSDDDWWVWPVREDSQTADAPLSVAATHQTECFDPDGNAVDCEGTGQDGEIRAGVPMSSVRFIDSGDGTVVDTLTGLVWLKQSNCLGINSLANAYVESANLADGDCGLSDGSAAGDWRVPNYHEFLSVLDLSNNEPQLTEGHPFTNIQNGLHWTSTTLSAGSDSSWKINPFWPNIHGGGKDNSHYTWPVRDP